jgi:long-chain fatty acid transport protein
MRQFTPLRDLLSLLLPKAGTLLGIYVFLASTAMATDGDELIGVGPYSRAMGGVGIAFSRDVISSVFNNPATLTTLDGHRFDFAGSILSPRLRASVKSPPPPNGVGNWSASSRDRCFPIPAFGFRTPCDICDDVCFALGAFGITGMGSDYRNTDPMNTNTNLAVFQFAPALAYKRGDLSLGASLTVDYQSADFGAGESHNYGYGARVGALYEMGIFAFGAVYTTPRPITHERIFDFDQDGTFDDFDLELPQKAGFGVSCNPSDRFVIETDIKWIDWHGAAGYRDFDWESQWVYAIGAEYRVTERLKLRAGFNYGPNVVDEHNGWNPAGTRTVQGKTMSTFGYEYFRVIGFPAIVERHITCGIGYDVTENFAVNLGLVKGLQNKIRETSAGGAVELKSSLSETFIELGLSWKF